MTTVNGIIRTNVQKFAPAMFAHPGAWSNLDWRSGMSILTEKKRCSKCGEWKDRSEFSKYYRAKDGLKPACKLCLAIDHMVYKAKDPEKIRESKKRSYRKNYERHSKFGMRYYNEMKEKIFGVLGNACARCGFSDKRALQVDHINGGGSHEKRELSTHELMKKVIKVGKSEYQLLCANCNWIKRAENGENKKRYE
jgi:hypothetical protein